ncbi:class I SAM-dependent methyltransferase [Pseudonocardia bannensis]|uniref:Class I SAM-dependent methyltransferase n=2 Tax=Pseudonocardia bannensis TaxID=630973 RepID=A0A848DEQ2_9PSEU|nr:class I SAM-dependent methyltransferase [Pseudonocardia bannensis]
MPDNDVVDRFHRTDGHYGRIARSDNDTWSDRSDYLTWMSGQIAVRLRMSSGARVADIGAGTGLFLGRLAERASPQAPILCVDPSPEMLHHLPEDPRLRPIHGTAEDVAAGRVVLPYEQLDAVLIKETIHHVTDVPGTVRGLAELLAPSGRMLVVTLPPRLDYPLFQAALGRFAAMQPEPESIANAMRAAGIETECTIEAFPVTVDRRNYIDLVGNKWMSVLSTFTDDELAAGLDEMRERYPQRELHFLDRFAFVRGVR